MRKSRLKWLLTGFLILVVGIIPAVVVLYSLVTWTPDQIVWQTVPTPDSRVQVQRMTQRLKAEAQAISEASRRRDPREFEIEVREQEINLLLQTDPETHRRLRAHGLLGARVRLQPERLIAEALLPVQGRPLYLTATGRPAIVNGRLAFEIDEARVGRLPAPEAVREAIERQLVEGMERLSDDLPARPVEVRVEDGGLRLTVRSAG